MLGKLTKTIWNLITKAVIAFVIRGCRLLRIQYTEKKKEKIFQFVKFGLVGISNTLLSYIIYILGLSIGIHYLVANICGYVIGILNSFYWNYKYVFKQKEKGFIQALKMFFKMALSYSFTGLILNNILLFLLVDNLMISKVVSPLIILLFTVPLNFILNKTWAFRNKDKE